jgi:hypothetical protein
MNDSFIVVLQGEKEKHSFLGRCIKMQNGLSCHFSNSYLGKLEIVGQFGGVPREHERAVDGGVRQTERVAELVSGHGEQAGRWMVVVDPAVVVSECLHK